MASRSARRTPEWQGVLRRSLLRLATLTGSVALHIFAAFLTLALISYKAADPALNTVAAPNVENLMGPAGAWAADLMLTFGGIGSALLLPLIFVCARRLWGDQDMAGWRSQDPQMPRRYHAGRHGAVAARRPIRWSACPRAGAARPAFSSRRA